MCDQREGGHTNARMLNLPNGWKCEACGFKPKEPGYLTLMAMKPRMQKLVVQEKQPPNSLLQSFWISPDALAALQSRFPSNLRTTLWALFNALADPDTILLEGEHARELRQAGVTRGRDIPGLARTNAALKDQLEQSQREMKQYELIAKMMAMAQGGQANSPAAQSPVIDAMLNPVQEKPPQQPVMPIISTESEVIYEPRAPGSFGLNLAG